MQALKLIVGYALMVFGFLLAVYASLWWAFIGGIVDVINAIRSPVLDATAIGIDIAKMMSDGVFGWAIAFFTMFPGWYLIHRSQ
jgi:hypothetical protein